MLGSAGMSLRAATPADFAFIRTVASHPENTPFITDEDETGLAAYLSDTSSRLLIWQDGAAPAGFALFCEVGHPAGWVELRRLALATTGQGAGLGFVHALTAHGFDVLGANRIWLDASGENPRAQKIYDKAGYTLEGCQRRHWWRPSLARAVDLMLYGILREDWRG